MTKLPMQPGSIVGEAMRQAVKTNETRLIKAAEDLFGEMINSSRTLYNLDAPEAGKARISILARIDEFERIWQTHHEKFMEALERFDLNKGEIDAWLACTDGLDALTGAENGTSSKGR